MPNIKDLLKEILPSIEPAFSGSATALNQRFDDARQQKNTKSLYSAFYTRVKSIYDDYWDEKRHDLEHCPFFVPEKTHAIIKARVERLGECIAATGRTGDDHQLLLYVLTIALADDEYGVAELCDPLNYHGRLVAKLQTMLKAQANDGFHVSLPSGTEGQRQLIEGLQQEVGRLEIENSDLRQKLQEALSDTRIEDIAQNARTEANQRLIAELKRQAKNTPQKEEVEQARAEARAVFKARLAKGKVTPKVKPNADDLSAIETEISALVRELPPAPGVASTVHSDVLGAAAKKKAPTSTTRTNHSDPVCH